MVSILVLVEGILQFVTDLGPGDGGKGFQSLF